MPSRGSPKPMTRAEAVVASADSVTPGHRSVARQSQGVLPALAGHESVLLSDAT